MNKKSLKLILFIFILGVISCDEPETVVTDIVHSDGSVLRKIEMRNKKNVFKPSSLRVPVDSTWIIMDTIEITKKGEKVDTVWIKRAEKEFRNVAEINREYSSDSGSNKTAKRKVLFSRKFKWFNTELRFSENVDRALLYGYPLAEYLNKEELDFYFLPVSISTEKLSGQDSTIYKVLNDTIEKKTKKWLWSCFVSEWIEEFSKLTNGLTSEDLSKASLKKHEKDVIKMIKQDSSKSDSLVIIKLMGEENYMRFKKEIDSSTAIVNRRLSDWRIIS